MLNVKAKTFKLYKYCPFQQNIMFAIFFEADLHICPAAYQSSLAGISINNPSVVPSLEQISLFDIRVLETLPAPSQMLDSAQLAISPTTSYNVKKYLL